MSWVREQHSNVAAVLVANHAKQFTFQIGQQQVLAGDLAAPVLEIGWIAGPNL